jgi:hypothetical protein
MDLTAWSATGANRTGPENGRPSISWKRNRFLHRTSHRYEYWANAEQRLAAIGRNAVNPKSQEK